MYYPEQRFIAKLMRIRRKATLPDEAFGNVQVKEGQTVDVRETVARGMIPARHIIIPAMAELGLKKPEELQSLMLVKPRTPFEKGTAIAGKDASRGKRILAPVNGILVFVGDGQIIIQEMPEIVTIEAGVRGRVVQLHEGRGVTIETIGGILQGVWGNDRNAIATLRIEPKDGLLSIPFDELDTTYKGEIIVTRSPLTQAGLDLGTMRNFAGIIAPSMDASLIESAKSVRFAVMLTNSFGDIRATGTVFSTLEELNGQQVTLSAAMPRRFEQSRPELVVMRAPGEEKPISSNPQALEIGSRVRVTREPYSGAIGHVKDLPNASIVLDNGLRVHGAVVELLAGNIVDVPLANLELAGG